MNVELLERLPVIEVISDEDYRSVALPCNPFPGDEKPFVAEVEDMDELLEAA